VRTSSALVALAARQFDVATRVQLLEAGLTRAEVDAQLDGRRWRAISSTVIVLHNGPLIQAQQWMAAVLTAEAPTGLAGRTAAQAAGLVGWGVAPVHIVVRRGAKVNPIDEFSIKVHESRRFTAADLIERTPRRVSTERALVDGAVWSTHPRTACGLIAAGVQQRLTTASRLRETLAVAGQVRHRRLLYAVLGDIEGGAQAVSELDFLRFCRRHGFPRPTLQVRVDGRGRRRYLDAEFQRHDGRRIGVEIDGAIHLVAATYWSDMSRLNDLVIGGRRILRFPSSVIYADDPQAVEQLGAALDLRHLSDRRRAIGL
jgi:hypothetical protein